MTDCSHVEWGARMPDGRVVRASSEPEAGVIAGQESHAWGASAPSGSQDPPAPAVVVKREVTVGPWTPVRTVTPTPAQHW
jgi:hypothetical protein